MPDGHSAATCVEVYDEPDHVCRVRNDCVYAYSVRLSPGGTTLWHRHTQDTIYVSLADGSVREDLPGRDAILTDVPCGAAVSRPHREEPLVHRVTNVGAGLFHVVGAEALARPAAGRDTALDTPGYALLVETARVRAYRVDTPPGRVRHGAAGLLIATAGCTVRAPADGAPQRLARGDLAWLDAPGEATFEQGCAGFFIEWLR